MRRTLILAVLAGMAGAVPAAADSTAVWEGRLRMGGIVKDETGDRSTMQETFNIHDGFSLTSLYLKGRFNPRTHLRFDLDDANLDNRRGRFDLRHTGLLHIASRYDESQYLFDPAGAVNATRRDLWSSVTLTPSRWFWLSGDYGVQTREGDRIGFPGGVESALGSAYDSDLHRYRVEAQARASNGIGGTVAYDAVSLEDGISGLNERDGHVYSAVVHVPGLVFKRLTHVVRGSIGQSEVPAGNVGYDMKTIQYTGLLVPWRTVRAKYRFYGGSVDDDATRMRTDRYIHDADVEWRYRAATLSGGYGWEAWDDDRSVTTYDNFRAALGLRAPNDRLSGRVAWAARNKEDEEDVTLLRDTEYARWDARLDARPMSSFTVGGRVADRTRRMPDVGAEATGFAASAYGRYDYEHFGDAGVIAASLGLDYRFSDDEYTNRVGAYHVTNHFVTGRVDVNLYEKIMAAAAVSHVSVGEDLDIDKSILSFELGYKFPRGFSVDAKYNVYNFDDYLIIDRYYTANVVWVNLGYEFSTE